MTTANLEDVITDSVSDSELPPEPVETETEAPAAEAAPVEAEASVQTPSPAAADKPEPDEFEKKFGIPAQSVTGRENRIPYSRVKKIIEKREKDLEASFTPKLAESEAKIKDYEGRLGQVAQFERVMREEPEKFVAMLKTLPQYQAILAPKAQEATPPAQAQPVDDMPQPDEKLADGSLVYSMEGLKALNAWNRAQARKEVMDEVQKLYGPIQQEWQQQQHLNAMVPQIQAQIAEARKWPLFNEHEADIVKALQADQRLSLEGAYRQVVIPRMVPDRDKMRQEILKEIKKAPAASTSAPAQATRPGSQSSGPRTLEQVINEAAGITS